MLKRWTIARATGVGTVAGLASVLLWLLYAVAQAPVRPVFIIALALTAFCGLSVLAITAADLFRHGRRGSRMRPIRAFDVAAALLLAVPSLLALQELLA